VSGHGLGGLVKQFELYRRAHVEGGVTPLTVVENLELVEDRAFELCAREGIVKLFGNACGAVDMSDSVTEYSG
jgi:hypothetical protein